jgi:hypothetical protein
MGSDASYKAGRSLDWIKIKTLVGRADVDEPRAKGGRFGRRRGNR